MLSSDLPLIKSPSFSVDYFSIDVIILIFRHLLPEHIAWLTTVNKELSQLVNYKEFDELWRARRVQHFHEYPHDQNAIGHFGQFKKTYKEQYKDVNKLVRRHFSMFAENDIFSLSLKPLLDPFNYFSLDRHDGITMAVLARKRNIQSSFDFIYAAVKKEFELKNEFFASTNEWDTQILKDGRTILYYSLACRQPLSHIQILLEQGSSFNELYFFGFGPVHVIAYWHNKIDVLEKLLEFYPEHLNLRNEWHETPIMLACRNGNDKLVEYLLKQPEIDLTGTSSREDFAWDIMTLAVRSGNINCIKLLMEYDLKNQLLSRTSIFLACGLAISHFHSKQIITIISEMCPYVHKGKDKVGQTILMGSCSRGLVEVVKYLLEQDGVDLTVEDNENKTALDYAISADHEKVITLILDKVKQDAQGEIFAIKRMFFLSYLFAVKNQKLETVKLILQSYPGFLNTPDLLGNTALLCAASNGHINIINYLIAQNAALIASNDGMTAIHFAAQNGNSEIADVLLNRYHAGLSFNKPLCMSSKLTLDVKGKLGLIEYMSNEVNYTNTTFGYKSEQKKIAAQELRGLVFYKGSREDYMDLLNRFKYTHEKGLGSSTLGKIYLNLKTFLQKKMESLYYEKCLSIGLYNRK